MAKSGKIGWFFGLIFGTILGILFAPRKGKEFRERIQKDRKGGGVGLKPLKEDMVKMGKEIADVAKEVYESEPIQNLVETGRKKVKEISGDLVSEVRDFHHRNIRPSLRLAKEKGKEGKRSAKKAAKEFREATKKVKASSKVAKKAFLDIKTIFRKKRR